MDFVERVELRVLKSGSSRRSFTSTVLVASCNQSVRPSVRPSIHPASQQLLFFIIFLLSSVEGQLESPNIKI